MQFDIEVILRNEKDASVERAMHPREPRDWTDQDVAEVLGKMLLAVNRLKNPDESEPHVSLRGFSWIVEPFDKGRVLIAIEIPMGAAVAGPFAIEQHTLDRMITAALQHANDPAPGGTIH
ncbi:MAG: hypothetical protein ACM36C_00130 [Acidobacteriota bacterium]